MKNLFSTIALSAALAAPQVHAQETDWFVEANLIGILYHELGHAMIDILQLPVLGQEEDAVDVLTILLIDELFDEEDAVELAYEVAFGYIGGENGDPDDEDEDDEEDEDEDDSDDEDEEDEWEDESPYWSVHGSGDQRFYNTVCLFYGSETDDREEFAEDMELPEERAEKCEAEYDLAYRSWGPILDGISGEGQSLQMLSTGNDPTIQIVTEAVAELNEVLNLPVQVGVRVTTCGQPSAFYNPDEKEIIFCWEYTAYLQDLTDRGYFQGADTGKWKMSGANTMDG